jgi:rare lipoprotein A
MSMRRLTGISIACLLTSACAISQSPEESASRRPSEAAGFPQGNEETPTSGTCYSPLRTTGISLFGKAAWYNLVGGQTASGEILDTVTATAAHRSLPLSSYAKVTNLDNGHAVVVKINDRGPYTRGRILDLSPRAADALDMKRAGVAAVALEPLATQTAPTVAALQASGVAVAQ